jgi:hypothetical protein
MSFRFFSLPVVLLILLAQVISSGAQAAYYMYIINPDTLHFEIKWTGPGPNQIKPHKELGPRTQVACWIIHGPDSNFPSAGLVSLASTGYPAGKVMFWVQSHVSFGIPALAPLEIRVQQGTPSIISGSAANPVHTNTNWIGLSSALVFRTWDCG